MPGVRTSQGSDPTDVSATGGQPVVVGVAFAFQAKGIYVGVGGNLTISCADGSSLAFVGVPAGTIIPMYCNAVSAATATNMLALW